MKAIYAIGWSSQSTSLSDFLGYESMELQKFQSWSKFWVLDSQYKKLVLIGLELVLQSEILFLLFVSNKQIAVVNEVWVTQDSHMDRQSNLPWKHFSLLLGLQFISTFLWFSCRVN